MILIAVFLGPLLITGKAVESFRFVSNPNSVVCPFC